MWDDDLVNKNKVNHEWLRKDTEKVKEETEKVKEETEKGK